MFLIRGCATQLGLSPEQMQIYMKEIYAWVEGLTEQGILRAAQPLTLEGKVVSGENGASVSDGVFAESKESVAGFFLFNEQTMDEAVGVARTCPMLKYGGELEVRCLAELKRVTA